MALKNYNPVTSSQRGLILVDKSALWKGKPVKALTEGKRKTGGRNNKGHVTSRGMAGGHKQKYRYIDFKRRKWDIPATVERLEYDPNRTAFIALIKYEDGEQAYILAPQRLAPGDAEVAEILRGGADVDRVVVGTRDITEAIREPGISSVVSVVATNRAVRELLVARQRAIRAVLGVKNMWHVGPSATWPLVATPTWTRACSTTRRNVRSGVPR